MGIPLEDSHRVTDKGGRSLTTRYLTGVFAPVLVAVVTQLTWPFFKPTPVSLYLLAVIFSAWYGGLGPGLLSTSISFLLSNFFFIEPYFSFTFLRREDAVRLLVFAVVGSFISVLGELLHKQKRRDGINLDISECAQESMSRLAAIVESSDDAIIGKTLAGIITSWNKGAEHIYGYTEAEVIGRSISILVPPILPDELPMILEKIRRREPVEHYETKRVTKDGRIISVSLTVSPIENTDGILIGASAIARDITERQQAEHALREAERKYRDIFENTAEGIFQTTADGRFITGNPAMARLLGFDSPEELVRERTNIAQQNYVDPTQREEFKRLLNEHDAVRGFEFEALRKDGSRIWMRESVRAVRDENGKLLYYEGIAEDITERKQVEAALGEKTEELDRYFASSLDLLCIADTDGYFRRLNPEWEKTLGYSLAELEGKRFLDFVHPDDLEATLAAISQLNRQEEVLNFVNRYRCRDNSYRWIEWRSFPQGKLIYAVARDITERKRAEESLQQAKEYAENLIQTANVIVVGLDIAGNVTVFNEAVEKISGYTRAELEGKNWFEVLVPKDRYPYVWEEFARLSQRGSVPRVFENPILTKSGEERLISWQNSELREDGKIVGTISFGIDFTERKLDEEQLRATTKQLRALSERLRSATEQEGARIAREIHDELGSAMTTLRWDLESLDTAFSNSPGNTQSDELRAKIKTMIELSDNTLQTIRRISSELRPQILDDLGLAEAIEWQAKKFQTRTGILCHCECRLKNLKLNQAQTTVVFRILQEALTNVLRHAQATRVDIKIKEEPGRFVMTISDDGRGITEAQKSAHESLGLLGMRERAELIGGTVEITGVQGSGTIVTARVRVSGQAASGK